MKFLRNEIDAFIVHEWEKEVSWVITSNSEAHTLEELFAPLYTQLQANIYEVIEGLWYS